MWDMGYRCGIRLIDMVIYHMDMVILDIDMGYGLMIWQMAASIRSSPISIWDILSLWSQPYPRRGRTAPGAGRNTRTDPLRRVIRV